LTVGAFLEVLRKEPSNAGNRLMKELIFPNRLGKYRDLLLIANL